MDVVVQESRNGKGIFAGRAFAPQEALYEVTGRFITGDEEEDIEDAVRDNAFRFSEDLYISPVGSIGDFQNHSCEPNAQVVKRDDRLFVVAMRQIKNAEEILIDYSTIIGADDVWEMQCNCGSPQCRSVVKSFDTLPAALRNTYRKNGAVPEYIARQ
jgi:hypothetical protein